MDTVTETAPGPLPRPPNRPPVEPIIIRVPRRSPGDLEVEIPGDTDDDPSPEIRRPPPWIPERLPPAPPKERATRP